MFLKCFYIAVPYMYVLLCVLHLCVIKDDYFRWHSTLKVSTNTIITLNSLSPKPFLARDCNIYAERAIFAVARLIICPSHGDQFSQNVDVNIRPMQFLPTNLYFRHSGNIKIVKIIIKKTSIAPFF